MAFPEMKVYCPSQPAWPINNGTFTKNPEPRAPTFPASPVPCTPKPLPKHSDPPSPLKSSNCLLAVFTAEALQLHTNGPKKLLGTVCTPLNTSKDLSGPDVDGVLQQTPAWYSHKQQAGLATPPPTRVHR